MTTSNTTIEELLADANEELLGHTQKLYNYQRIEREYKALLVEHEKVSKREKTYRLEKKELEILLANKDNENVNLKKETERLKKKIVTVQSILQLLISAYGIEDVSKIIGIPYIKLKEYLQE